MNLTPDMAREVWTVLVVECGARWEDRNDFVLYATSKDPLEYRFSGNLGFGGKCYFSGGLRVGYYPEDRTPERDQARDRANAHFQDMGIRAR